MSELRRSPVGRPSRRADARRSADAVLEAAIGLLSQRPEASMEEIAAAAGVARQTVYAHYPKREVLLGAVIDRITSDVVAAFDAADLDTGPATAALVRWLKLSWLMLERYPVLLTSAVAAADAQHDHDRHMPIMERLDGLIRRGQEAGEFDQRLSPAWMIAATIGLGHTAGQEVSAGRMSSDQAGSAFRESVIRVFGAAVS